MSKEKHDLIIQHALIAIKESVSDENLLNALDFRNLSPVIRLAIVEELEKRRKTNDTKSS